MALRFTRAEVDAFRAAMLKNPGVLEMQIADQRYKFDSMEAMQKRYEFMEAHVDDTRGGSSSITRFAATRKGV